MLREFHEGTRVRQAKSGDGYIASLIALTFKVPRRYGGYVIHIGVVLMFVAFTGKSFKFQEPERPLSPGQEVSARDYRITYTGSGLRLAARRRLRLQPSVLVGCERRRDRGPAGGGRAGGLASPSVASVCFHIETKIGSAKMTVRFKDKEARDLLRDDLYLAQEFMRDFVRVSDDPAAGKQVWRIEDQGLLKVVPMLAMQRVRRVKARLGPGSTIEAEVASRGGSADVALTFDDRESLQAFDTRLAGLSVPESLVYGGYDADTGALEFVDGRTGMLLAPEVRFYAKHDTPTTETAIASTLHEDLYLAMRPAMGQNFINLLTVVFPLVSFLWTGSLVLLLGTLLCLTPRWVSRTVIGMTRSSRGRGRAAARAATAAGLVLLTLAPLTARAAPLPEPRGMSAPGPEGALTDILKALTCACPATDGVERTVADPVCECPKASVDRELTSQLLGQQPKAARATGRAKLEVLAELTRLDAGYDARLRYSRADYQRLLTTTKTTCTGERGLVLSQSQLGCSVRNLWLPRFRHMLASGMTVERVHKFYVDENNVTMAPSVPWSYADLKAHADKALSWALPAAVLFAFLAGLLAYAVRRTRRNRAMAAAAPVVQVTALSERDRLVLEDELDLLDA